MEFNQNQKLALVALVGLSVIGFGLWERNRGGPVDDDIKIIQPAGQGDTGIGTALEDAPKTGKSRSSPILVHVAGEVKRPDVYTLPPGSRVIDAIKRAGGATLGAQLDALNLAAIVRDGDKILVPSKFQSITSAVTQAAPTGQSPQSLSVPSPVLSQSGATSASATGKLKNPGDGVVNINTGDSIQLQRLPGVGPSTAQKIIEYRAQIGRFSIPDQLMDVKGIGPKKFEKLKPFISL